MSHSRRTRAEWSSRNELSSEIKAAMMHRALYSSAYKGCIDDVLRLLSASDLAG